ncbi:helix-turn-helix domain-containing protein [Anaerotruncus massiliensis (ex Togo et al. 2019)]|uniref:helix-turn-helix domain-containing protein n=1 Tax=Anaerotruncus TaxID=244127 RepID=UPI002086F28F|nr:helix-turn-helix transcriptional regulator [Anaerotruncus massiliensis (ex Togo et al. 2019)]GKH48040.1 hypothetical protein CE91St45_26020 [Oscillospiraceae bacterium]
MGVHAEKFRKLGLSVAHYRKLAGFTQEELADLVHISRGYLSHIEAPNIEMSFSITTLFDICDALHIEPKVLFEI